MNEFELFCLRIASLAIQALDNDEEAVDYMEQLYKEHTAHPEQYAEGKDK